MGRLWILSVLCSCLCYTHSANILAVFPHVGKSHFYMFDPFVTELANRGHQITVVSHFPPSEVKNVKHVSLEGTLPGVWFNALRLDELESHSQHKTVAIIGSLFYLNQIGQQVCELGLAHAPVQQLIKSNAKYDLVIVEYFNNDCYAGFAHVFQAPLVGIFSSAMMPWHNDRFGNPDNPSYIPNHFTEHPQKMDFVQRFINSLATFGIKIVYKVANAQSDLTAKKYFGADLPPLADIVKNTSLFLINSHFSLFQPRPLVPGIIELGGFHVKPPKKLPPHIEQVMDKSPNGVVYFSLGSTLLGSSMSEAKRRIMANVFSKLKMNVLWKWEDETMPDKPDNVYIQKWLPQNDILGHPKVKLFITHCGLMGIEEAVYSGVPMILMPLFGDQPLNAASVAEKGAGIIQNYHTMTEESLYTAVTTILEDKSYAENAKRLSLVFKDRPISVMDTAIYWVEYVIRHRGARHLRSAATDLKWYQEYLIDVFLAYALLFFSFCYLTYKMFAKFLRTLFCRNQPQNTKQKQKAKKS